MLPAIGKVPSFFENQQQQSDRSEEKVRPRVPADEDQPTCPLCGDEFVVDFDDNTEQWMCVDCVITEVRDLANGVNVNRIVHRKCQTPGTVPVLVAPSPRSGPCSPDLHSQPLPTGKRPLELQAGLVEQLLREGQEALENEAVAAKRVKREPGLEDSAVVKLEEDSAG